MSALLLWPETHGPQLPARTMREVCEACAAWLQLRYDARPELTGEFIFNLSPTGELYHVWDLYDFCLDDGMPLPPETPEARSR